jgi:hypothetical protein
MFRKSIKLFIFVLLFALPALPVAAQKSCFTEAARSEAERTAKVFAAPDPDYDPVLGYNPKTGPSFTVLFRARSMKTATSFVTRSSPTSKVRRAKKRTAKSTASFFHRVSPKRLGSMPTMRG